MKLNRVTIMETSRHPNRYSSPPPAHRQSHISRQNPCNAWSRRSLHRESGPRPQVRFLICMAHQMPTYLPGFDPGNVTQLIGFIKIQDQAGIEQAHRVFGYLDGTPGRVKRYGGLDPDTVRPGCQVGLKNVVAPLVQDEAGVVDQCGFVNTEVGSAGVRSVIGV